MNRYKREIDIITKALDLNGNNFMSYDELRNVLFNVRENVFLNILSDMLSEGLLISKNEKYQLPPTLYAENIEKTNKKKQLIVDRNNRLSKLRNEFSNAYYRLEEAKHKYISILNNDDITNFTLDMKALGYTVSNNYLIFQFISINDYLTNELMTTDVIEIKDFISKYKPLIDDIDFDYLLEKLKRNYQIIQFDKNSYINIKQLNKMGIYISDIKQYSSKVYNFSKSGDCFSVQSLRKNGFYEKLDDLGMGDIFYENLLKYDGKFLMYKMSNCYVFSTSKKPSVSNIVYDIVKNKISVSIYDLQDILKIQFGITTTFVSENGNLINQSLLFDENTNLYYSKEFEKIYFNKEDYYKEVEYDE